MKTTQMMMKVKIKNVQESKLIFRIIISIEIYNKKNHLINLITKTN